MPVLKQLQSLAVITPLGTGTKCSHKLMFLPLVSMPLNILYTASLINSSLWLQNRKHVLLGIDIHKL